MIECKLSGEQIGVAIERWAAYPHEMQSAASLADKARGIAKQGFVFSCIEAALMMPQPATGLVCSMAYAFHAGYEQGYEQAMKDMLLMKGRP